MKLNYAPYYFFPQILIPKKWGKLLRKKYDLEKAPVKPKSKFFLQVLASPSLQGTEKLKVLSMLDEMKESQILELSALFPRELKSMADSKINSEPSFAIALIGNSLRQMMFVLRFHNIIETATQENAILTEIMRQWLDNIPEHAKAFEKSKKMPDGLLDLWQLYCNRSH